MDTVLPISKAKSRLLDLVRRAKEEGSIFTLTKHGEPEGIIMSYDEYESLRETLDILSDRKLMKRSSKASKNSKPETSSPMRRSLSETLYPSFHQDCSKRSQETRRLVSQNHSGGPQAITGKPPARKASTQRPSELLFVSRDIVSYYL
jgi:antitoxin YefM